MAKVFTFQDMTKPAAITGTPVAGGTLAANTTYYYRVIGTRESSGAYASYWVGKTKSSDEFSATTNTVNKSIQISFTQPAGEGLLSYRIFRWTTSGGMLDQPSACIGFYPMDVTYRSGTTITFIDNGYANVGGNTYLNTTTDPHGVLTLSGSLTGDRFSIVDLYNADQSNGWNVIQRIDKNTYLVNCYLNLNNQFWSDSYKTIIFADAYTASGADMSFGIISGANQTSGTCNVIISSQWLASVGPNILNAYRTNFLYVYPWGATGNIGLCGLAYNSGIIQDCTCERFRNFTPNSSVNCTIKNFTFSAYDNAFSNGKATFLNVRMLQGSRAWQIGTDVVSAKGVFVDGGAACLLTGGAGTLNLVDSQFVNPFLVNASATGTVLNDKISFNMNVVDQTQTPISSANVKIYDNTSTLVVDVVTDSNGNIAEQEITRRQFTVTGTTVNPVINKYPFTIVISKTGFETYTEKVSYLLSLAVIKTIALNPIVNIRMSIDGKFLKAILPETGSSAKLIEL